MFLSILESISPVFVLLALGYGLRLLSFAGEDFWKYLDRFCYQLLFPTLLFSKISTVEISSNLLETVTISIYGGFFAGFLTAYILAKAFSTTPALSTSVIQGACRHNTFMALALSELLLGAEGLAIATLVSAVLIPITNVTLVMSMAIIVRRKAQQNLVVTIIYDLVRNPLIIGMGLGFIVNLSDAYPLPVVSMTADILGQAALPLILMSVGAHISVKNFHGHLFPAFLSMVGKLLVFPTAVYSAIVFMNADPLTAMVLMIFGVVPTAPSGFSLAKAMGGDAEAMASIITVHTLCAFVMLPVMMFFFYQHFGLP